MLFSSLTFIYVFLPVVTTLYLLVRREGRNYVLLIASLLFYAWGEPKFLAVMILNIIITYVFGILLDSARADLKISRVRISAAKVRLVLLLSGVCLLLAILGYFKYFNFIIENVNLFREHQLDFIKVVLPIGISFYTFQSVSYLIDIKRRISFGGGVSFSTI